MAIKVRVMAITLMCLLVATRSDWVDYPSGIRCCSDIPVDRCDPKSPVSNSACRDVCHYGGCRKGGQCEYIDGGVLGVGRGCHCNC